MRCPRPMDGFRVGGGAPDVPKENKVNVIPLGGIGEIGKNMMAIEYDRKILVIDAGLMFPEEEMLGIDVVIPDISYLLENKNRILAMILTHGHEDHIGAVPYVLQQIDVPIYGTRLTLGLVEGKLKEQGIEPAIPPVCIRAGDRVELGPFTVEFIHVTHSIADVVALAITCPAGIIIHTSDFKADQTPIGQEPMDFSKFAEYGQKGVLLLLSDSTNAERPGYTLSEREVGEAFEETFRRAQGRILVATFASNIYRIQQIIDSAWKFDRKVAFVGRSMENVVGIALDLGYLEMPDGMMIELDAVDRVPPGQLVIITTGSQGEPMSALTRMAMAEHKKIGIMPGDTVIISASPIPGNEKFIGRTINHLFRQGADVIYEAFSGVHVSGHASQEELKLMLNLVMPKYFIPVHGEYRHLVKHARLARQVGLPEEHIFIPDIGDVLEFGQSWARVGGKVTAGKVLVDGLGIGDVGNVVLRDRKQLAEDGILIVVVTIDKQTGAIVAGPDVVSRGFVYVKESERLLEDARSTVKEVVKRCEDQGVTEWETIKRYIRDSLRQFIFEKMKRRPMILPIVMEV